jgi:hypothetical protein
MRDMQGLLVAFEDSDVPTKVVLHFRLIQQVYK